MKLLKRASRQNTPIPQLRSGWFYIWLILLLALLWGEHRNYWSMLEKANLQFWQEMTLLSAGDLVDAEQNTIRITDLRLDSDGLEQIKQLSNKYPKATFAILGDYSLPFITKLNSPTYRLLSGRTTLLGKDGENSLTALSSDKDTSAFYERALSLDGLTILSPTKIKWSTYQHVRLALQPKQSSVAQAIIWQNHANFYASFVGHSVMQNLAIKSVTDAVWKVSVYQRIEIMLGDVILPLGIGGNIVPKFTRMASSDYADILSNPLGEFTGIIIIDDLSVNNSELIAQAINDFANQEYLYGNLLTEILQIMLLVFAIVAVFRSGGNSLIVNILIAVSGLVLLFTVQYFHIVLSFWTPLHLIILIAILSGFCQWAYQKEKSFLLKAHESKSRKSKRLKIDLGDEIYDKTLVINTADNLSNGQAAVNLLKLESFGRYQVNGILGKGAMGIVFQGLDPKINRSVAIKTLQLNDQLDNESLQDTKERFFKEAETAGNLSHANIVTIYDVGEEKHPKTDQSLGYIAMDLLTGQPLSEHIKKGKLLPPSLIYQLMIQLTDALEYAHNQNVIHRDIKPANIIYDDDLQRGTITDFGIAHISDHSKTKTGTIIGSPFYMSPEQILGIKVDCRSDIFSLGVTFYQLLSGALPFTGESIASVAFHITKTKHTSVRTHNKKLYSSAARITNKALQKDKRKRYQSMQEFKQALVNALKRDYRKSPLQ